MKLKDKVVLITGGTSGIGAATARLFQSEGATVIVTGSSAKTVEAARPNLPGVEVVVADQADTSTGKALVHRLKDCHGRIDVLFVNAGIGKFVTLDAADEAHFDLLFNTNVRGPYFMAKHAAPIIPNGGLILFTGSVAGSKGSPGESVYSATKAAVRSLARTLAAELAVRNVRVNVISPGLIETPILGKVGLTEEQLNGWVEGSKRRIPLGRLGQPEEVAATALYLAADASYTTGAELIIGGGLVDV
jgi:NAD(P)-dependent dehydrogenase (short-subunit alcohol dehydrogenase family)